METPNTLTKRNHPAIPPATPKMTAFQKRYPETQKNSRVRKTTPIARKPADSKKKVAMAVERTILTGIPKSRKDDLRQKSIALDPVDKMNPKAANEKRMMDRMRGKKPAPGSCSWPRGIWEEEMSPKRDTMSKMRKATLSVFMEIIPSPWVGKILPGNHPRVK